MELYKLIFNKKTETSKNEFENLVWFLMAYYYKNGQSLSKENLIYYKNEKIVVYINTPERDWFNEKFNTTDINKILKEMSSYDYIWKGHILDSTFYCSCLLKEIDYFIISTNYLSYDSPLICGKCKNPYPLYKIPSKEKYYEEILTWVSDYKSCENLYFNSRVEEDFFYNQLSNYESSLSKMGQAIAKKISKTLKKKIYYSLYNSKNIQTCTKCRMKIKENKCEKCCLFYEI